MSDPRDIEIDLARALAARRDQVSAQVLTLYIPNRDRNGNEFGTQRYWLLEAGKLLAKIGGGFTIMPPVEGGWVDPATERTVWEQPVLIYTYVHPDEFRKHLPELRSFLHRMGRETKQGEVALEFHNRFYRITDFDPDVATGQAEIAEAVRMADMEHSEQDAARSQNPVHRRSPHAGRKP